MDVTEYYDYPNNRGMVRRMKGGVSSIWLYDFTDFESFLIVGEFTASFLWIIHIGLN